MTRRLVGATVSLLALLAGLWLVLSPFALGFQPQDADWTDNTLTDVWTGIPLAVVGLAGVIVFALALQKHMVQAGYITPRPAPAPEETPEPAATGRSEDLDAMLTPLIAALARDIARENDAEDPTATTPHHHREYGTSALGTDTGAVPAVSAR